MRILYRLKYLAVIALLFALAGCSGGGGGNDDDNGSGNPSSRGIWDQMTWDQESWN